MQNEAVLRVKPAFAVDQTESVLLVTRFKQVPSWLHEQLFLIGMGISFNVMMFKQHLSVVRNDLTCLRLVRVVHVSRIG